MTLKSTLQNKVNLAPLFKSNISYLKHFVQSNIKKVFGDDRFK